MGPAGSPVSSFTPAKRQKCDGQRDQIRWIALDVSMHPNMPPTRAFSENRLLAMLAESAMRRLLPDMQAFALTPASVLFEAGQPIGHVIFPLTGIVSLIVTGEDGDDVEIATIGNEGVAGLGGLLAGEVLLAPSRSVRRPSSAHSARTFPGRRQPQRDHAQRSRGARRCLFQLSFLQSAACNARHDAEQRLARWILTLADRSGERTLPFTHHHIAEMLGRSQADR